VLLSSWYSSPIVDRVFKRLAAPEFDQRLDEIVEFERMLVKENVLLVKLWFHLSKSEQKSRFKALEKDPDTRWRVTPTDWVFHKKYDRFRKVCERALMKTSTGGAPWNVIEGTDRRYRDLEAGRVILEALRNRSEESKAAPPRKVVPDRPKPKARNVIRRLDLSLKLAEKPFEERLEKLQGRLGLLTRRLREKGRSMILAFEGPDAAGKGGTIRRLTRAMDARLYRVDSVAAPTDEEKARPYLWRFWRDLPRTGRVTLYDRTWYGRVLVERIEGFATPGEWGRAYNEINAFESQLADFGVIMRKFWIAISPEEQLKRFKDRQVTPYKQYKITEEDWRNREKWNAYEAAACEMIERTSTRQAPWTLIEGEDKNWARIKVLETVVAVRRLRPRAAASPPLGSEVGGPRRRLKGLLRATGPARDAEVSLVWLSRGWPRPAPRHRHGVLVLRRLFEGRRRKGYEEVRDRGRERFRGLERKLYKGLGKAEEEKGGISEEVRRRLSRQAAKLSELFDPGTLLDPRRAHKLRIRVKKARYLLEPFDGGLRGCKRALGALKELQTLLGDLHDRAVLAGEATSLAETLPRESPAREGLLEAVRRLGSEEGRLRERAQSWLLRRRGLPSSLSRL
jgi:polyphosphate:AMP phosphotransferase